MPKQEGQKSKLLTLLRILEQKTDEEHLLNVPQLVELLEQQDILAERKSIYSDIDTLRSLGFDVLLSPWDNPENIRSLATNAIDSDMMGVLLTTWDHLPGYLQKIFTAAEHLWQNLPAADHPSERAHILRRVYDAEGDFFRAGWNPFEVEG